MKWLGILSLGLLLAMCPIAFGQETPITRQYKGKPDTNINVGVFFSIKPDCTAGPLPTIRLSTPPAHGKVTVKQGNLRATNLKQCLGINLPAFIAVYRSEPDYVDQDTFVIELTDAAGGKKQIQQITVTLQKPSEGI
jgi:hypothetical protein